MTPSVAEAVQHRHYYCHHHSAFAHHLGSDLNSGPAVPPVAVGRWACQCVVAVWPSFVAATSSVAAARFWSNFGSDDDAAAVADKWIPLSVVPHPWVSRAAGNSISMACIWDQICHLAVMWSTCKSAYRDHRYPYPWWC